MKYLIAILLLVVLLAIFITSFILYVKTPVPKGCEYLVANKKKCQGCNQAECQFSNIYEKKEENQK